MRNRTGIWRLAGLFFMGMGIFLTAFLTSTTPLLAVSPSNVLLNDPKDYFPQCACQAAFGSFIIWMISLVIIAMFQYDGRKKVKKLNAIKFSLIAVVLFFLVYSTPMWIMAWLLQPSNFHPDQASGTYKFSVYGEKEGDFTGKYTVDELQQNIKTSRNYLILSWGLVAVVSVAGLIYVPAHFKRQAKKKEESQFKRKKNPSKGRVGTKKASDKKQDAKGDGKEKKK